MTAIIIGVGAAGLATATFAKRAAPHLDVRCLDGATKIGAKILVSGGSRCNVTNRVVTERDFWGGSSRVVRSVLRAFPAERAAAFFESLGVKLHEEVDGKLFPDTNRSRTILEALIGEAQRLGVTIETGRRVIAVDREQGGFLIKTSDGVRHAAHMMVLATGGRSLPKTGSDGLGYELARTLGHGYVETTPALAPLVLDGDRHINLAGVSHDAVLSLSVNGATTTRLEGSILWTHFGISGPVALNVSRHWLRARLEGQTVAVTASVVGDMDFESVERFWMDRGRARPLSSIGTTLASLVPASVASALLRRLSLDPPITLAAFRREDRRRLTAALTGWPLAITGSRGYNYAEVTAGGVDLREIDPATMESRRCPGLYLVGEILDVDGRIGGFNFQWAWSSAAVVAAALARKQPVS